MRFVTLASLLLVLSGLAAAQGVDLGLVTNTPAFGVYAAPFVPRVTTPSVSLGIVAPSPAGASNATWGNVAGARNATLSIVAPVPTGVRSPVIPYDNSDWVSPGLYVQVPAVWAQPQGNPASGGRMMIELGTASTPGVRQLMASAGPVRKASRTFTNDDVDRVHQSIDQNTGTVKIGGKTEHVN